MWQWVKNQLTSLFKPPELTETQRLAIESRRGAMGGIVAAPLGVMPGDNVKEAAQFNYPDGKAFMAALEVLHTVTLRLRGDFRLKGEGPPLASQLWGKEDIGNELKIMMYDARRNNQELLQKYREACQTIRKLLDEKPGLILSEETLTSSAQFIADLSQGRQGLLPSKESISGAEIRLLLRDEPDDYLLKHMLRYPQRMQAFTKNMHLFAQELKEACQQRGLDMDAATMIYDEQYEEYFCANLKYPKAAQRAEWVQEIIQNFSTYKAKSEADFEATFGDMGKFESLLEAATALQPAMPDPLTELFGGLVFRRNEKGGCYCQIKSSAQEMQQVEAAIRNLFALHALIGDPPPQVIADTEIFRMDSRIPPKQFMFRQQQCYLEFSPGQLEQLAGTKRRLEPLINSDQGVGRIGQDLDFLRAFGQRQQQESRLQIG